MQTEYSNEQDKKTTYVDIDSWTKNDTAFDKTLQLIENKLNDYTANMKIEHMK